MSEFETFTIESALKRLKKGEVSSEDLTKHYLDRIEKIDSSINSYITVSRDSALKQSKESDSRYAGKSERPLEGVPISLKDIFVTDGIKTTAGSRVLQDYVGQYDGAVVERLKAAGAVIIGKTNCDAWAHGSSGENSDFNSTKNPYNLKYVPGGSSSGSSASVAASLCLGSTGTDTGGSVRLPASFCNVVGLKPTYGLVPRYGVISMASSFDSVGHFTKTVHDSALMLNVTAGRDRRDATSITCDTDDYTQRLGADIKGMRIGLPQEYFTQGVDQGIKDIIETAISFYKEAGCEIVDISLPHTQYAISTYYIIQTAEVSSNLGRYDGVRYGVGRDAFGEEAKRRIMLGTYVLSSGYSEAYYKKGMQVRTLIREDFDKAFENVDVILTPASPQLPWKIGEKVDDPLRMYLSDVFTVTANLAGVPGISVPAGFVDGLPVGMQLLGPQKSESLLFQMAYPWEQNTEFYKRVAAL